MGIDLKKKGTRIYFQQGRPKFQTKIFFKKKSSRTRLGGKWECTNLNIKKPSYY